MTRQSMVSSFVAMALAATGWGCAVDQANLDVETGSSETGALRPGLTVGLQAARADRTRPAGGGNVVARMEQIVVSVSAVAAHVAGGGWVVVSDTPAVVDLLRLQDHAEALGFTHLPAGTITQIRLYVADDDLTHVVDREGATRPLIVPSGLKSGIKLKGPFELGPCEHGTAVGVMDVERSIRVHGRGNHEQLILRPVIHGVEFTSAPADVCDGAGDVTEVPPGTDVDDVDEDVSEGEDDPVGGDGAAGGDETSAGDDTSVDAPGDAPTDAAGCPEGAEGCVGGGSTGADAGATDPADADDAEGATDGGSADEGTSDADAPADTSSSAADECSPILTESGLVDICGEA